MSKKILIDAVYPGETRVVIYDKNRIQDFDYENSYKKQLKGNIYLARITRIEPSLQAAFIEYGGDKHGFLPFNEVHPSYFNSEENSAQNGKVLADKLPLITLPEEVEDIAAQEPQNTESESPEETAAEDNEIEAEAEDISNHDDLHQKNKIQNVLKKGQVLLIQIIKEERGNKGAACTTYISLAGRYCVLMPNSDKQGGISRRIQNIGDRKKLKDVINSLDLPEGVSIILRTAGAGRNPNDIRRDYFYLARLWNALREHVLEAKINSFIHAESDLIKRTIRDLYSSEVSEIQIQGHDAYKSAKEFMKKILPLHAGKIKEYKSKAPIFTKYEIESQINALYVPTTELPSGGYIVINPTEALIAIDVNSGKATNERNIEETATKTNIEAAAEIARQLRLRDMSGLVVIDFIDMMDSNNRRLVERTLRDAFQTDRARVQLSNISAFGLLELSRQRLQSSLMEASTISCPSCKGKGHIKSFAANALNILRTIESEIYDHKCQEIKVFAHPDMVIHLLNNNRQHLARLETEYETKITLNKEDAVYYDGFAIEKANRDGKASAKSDAPQFSEEEYFDSYGQDVPEIEIAQKEEKFGFGADLAPYQVNDDEMMGEKVENYKRTNRNARFKKPVGNRRKISGTSNSSAQPPLPVDKPALIYQPETANNGARKPNKRRQRYNKDRRAGREIDGNKENEKKSMLQSWWEKLID